MGRFILFILLLLAIWLVWRAFGPGSRARIDAQRASEQPPAIKGPDDDEDFLWSIEKQRFKQRRAKEEQERRAREEEERQKKFRRDHPEEGPAGGGSSGGEWLIVVKLLKANPQTESVGDGDYFLKADTGATMLDGMQRRTGYACGFGNFLLQAAVGATPGCQRLSQFNEDGVFAGWFADLISWTSHGELLRNSC
ncbi:hypothetical protein CCYS_02250 [Corynebacterium cystitidis DSM 20524]|uniref:Uncharacterized protein n=1 Tax=Corynebacterium cystitidis DSM 20524 TaxID=1121357 RepID=A0A1H9VJ14_9CORY|nr:hypothetical protein CCYS_02250 [Corynebacterium cystitidis DSM 20524]SES21548.1 hypothetical protein SAMN05661109_02262 [Corynebacterium cystitidis DSM 20524]SNV87572.1 putative secreted protein [Corynebacterium cystitidis]